MLRFSDSIVVKVLEKFREHATSAGFGLALLLLVVIALLAYRSISDLVEQARWIEHAHQVIGKTGTVLFLIRDAEISQRDYVLAGDRSYLEPYNAAVTEVGVELAALERLSRLHEDARRQADLKELERLITQRLRALEEVVEQIRARGDFGPARARLLTQAAATAEGEIRILGTQVREREDALLAQRALEAQASATQVILIIVLGGAASVAILMLSFGALRDEVMRRRKAQEELARYAEDVEDLYNRAPCGYHSLDRDGMFMRINDTELAWLGYTRAEVVGKLNFADVLTPASRERFRRYYPQFMQRGTVTDTELELLRKDGSLLPVALSATAMRDAAGTYVMSRSSAFDITDRRRAQRKLHDANAFLNSTLDNIPDMVFVKDARTLEYLQWNRASETVLGFTREEAIGRTDLELFGAEAAAQFQSKDREVLAQAGLIEIPEEQVPTREGRVRILHTKKLRVADESGVARYLLGIAEDITNRKRSQDQFRALLEAAPDAMVIVNARGQIVLANSQVERLFAYSREDLLGQSIELLLPERYRNAHPFLRKTFFDNPSARAMGGGNLDLWGRRRDGSEFAVEISLSPLRTEDGLLVTAAIRDISERRRKDEEIRTLNTDLQLRAAQLETTNSELEGFSYSVSHDLRSPLRAIDGYSLMLEEDYGTQMDEEGRRLLAVVRGSARKMGQLIDDLLAFSRLGRKPLLSGAVDMDALVREAAGETSVHGAANFELRIDALPAAWGDRTLLRQVWVNLLSNAVKYSSARPTAQVQVSGQRDGLENIYRVRDNGVGFDMRYYDKLFGVFQRLHSTDEFSGTGVGLAIVQRIVTRHGGRAWAEGVVGQGATFYFSLPREELR